MPPHILHLFNRYLNKSEHWAFDLIRHTPDVKTSIAARRFLPHNYYPSDFTFVDTFLGGLQEAPLSTAGVSLVNRLFKRAGRWLMDKGTRTDTDLLLEYIRQNRVDILHAHFAPVAVHYKDLIERAGLPLVVSFYGYDYEYLPFTRPEYRQSYQWLFQRADQVLCEGPYGMQVLANMGCPAHKLTLQPLGIVPEPTLPRPHKASNTLRLLQVAAFTEKKGQLDAVKAFHTALDQCPDMTLTLVGSTRDEAYFEAVKSYIAESGLADKVRLLHWIDGDQLAAFMADYHVFIHPSRYSRERDCEGGAPVVLMRAQWQGLPVIATTHCDIPFLVQHPTTGLLTPEAEVAALAQSIIHFYRMDDADFQGICTAITRWAQGRFGVAEQGLGTLQRYKALMLRGNKTS